ncbi:MAG: hypothetical protein PHC83_08570 [Bacteroidales bacterium]|nr:hypothetical protein [Bacteroidales bacterium]
MPYLNTNSLDLAVGFYDYINKKLLEKKGYMGAKFTSRIDEKFIEKYGKFRIGLNDYQSPLLGITPKNGSGMFTEEEIIELLKQND